MKERDRYFSLLWVMLLLFAGAYCASIIGGNILISSILLLALGVLQFLRRTHITLYIMLLCSGYLVASVNRAQDPLPQQKQNITVAMHVDRSRVGDIYAILDRSGEWHKNSQRVLIYGADSLEYRDAIVAGSLCEIDPTRSRFEFSMFQQGFNATLKIGSIKALSPSKPPIFIRLNRWAMQRLEGLNLSREAFASSAAMALDRGEFLESKIKKGFQKSGTSHLLALSGMHLGIVITILMLFTALWPIALRGNIAADIFLIVAVWLFAAVSGMSHSVMRATWMYTIFQLLITFARGYLPLNSLFITAIAMFAFDPAVIYDLSFQLSFTAVAAILLIAAPLMKLYCRGGIIFNYFVGSLTLGTIATLATAPLAAYYFDTFSLLSPISTLLLVPFMMVIIAASLLWIVLPAPLLAPLLRYSIEIAVVLQNRIVEWLAGINLGSFTCHISGATLLIIYALAIAIAIFAKRKISAQLLRESR